MTSSCPYPPFPNLMEVSAPLGHFISCLSTRLSEDHSTLQLPCAFITFLSFQCPPHNETQQRCLHILSVLWYCLGPLLHLPFKPLLSFTNRFIWGAIGVAYQLTKQWPPVISLSLNSPSNAWLLEFCSCMENCNLSWVSVVAVLVIMKVYFSLMYKHCEQ